MKINYLRIKGYKNLKGNAVFEIENCENYFDYFKKLNKSNIDAKLPLLYVNKFSWNIALIALLCAEKSEVFIQQNKL